MRPPGGAWRSSTIHCSADGSRRRGPFPAARGRIAALAAGLVLALLPAWGCGESSAESGQAGAGATAEARHGEASGAGDDEDRAVRRAPPVQEGARVILVTGSTDGLGREVARRLAASGDHVIVHGRDRERGHALVEEIHDSGAGSARFYRADFGDLTNVRRLASDIRRDYDRLDVLVNNAGMLASPDERPVSADGHELHFQVNYLAPFLLTHELLPLLRESAPARVVNVASRSQRPVDFGNVMLEEGYSAGRAYGQSKMALIMFTFELAEALEGTGVTANAVHPATLMDTELVTEMGMEPRSTVAEGARALLHLVNDESAGSGRYYEGTDRARAEAQAYDEQARTRLMELSRELTGVEAAPGG